jgi:hypothetical protein
MASGPELPFLITLAHQWRDIDGTLGLNHEQNYALSRDATRTNFRRCVLDLLASRLSSGGKRRLVLNSFGMALALNSVAELFPQARFIMTVRDPRSVAGSLLHCEWVNPRDGRPLPYTRSAAAGGHMWAEFMRSALPHALALEGQGRLMFLRYEDLCRDSFGTVARLSAFLSAPGIETAVRADSASLVTLSADQPHPSLRIGPIDRASVESWRNTLNGDVAWAEQIPAPLRATFGYV